jgi:hypothetical protein
MDLPDLKFEVLGVGVENYVISVTREDGVKVRVLIPKPGCKYYDACLIKNENPCYEAFGLNLVTSGHYD